MQKKIIALAVAALASGAAFAQSNVTIYGAVDVGFSHRSGDMGWYANIGPAPGNPWGASWVKQWSEKSMNSIDSSIAGASFIGFKGVEDLGNGTSALFVLEAGFNADTGTQPGQLFNEQAFVGLTAGWGTAIAGRLKAPRYGLIEAMDPFSAGTVGRFDNVYSDQFTTNVPRVDNAVAYVSPSFSGFTVTAAYATNAIGGEGNLNANNAGNLAGANNNPWQPTLGATILGACGVAPPFACQRFFRMNANDLDAETFTVLPRYTNGPLDVGVAYQRVKLKRASSIFGFASLASLGVETGLDGTAKQDQWTVAGSYDFGVVKLSAAYDRFKAKGALADNDYFGNAKKATSWLIGVSVPFGKSAVQFSYNQNNAKWTNYTYIPVVAGGFNTNETGKSRQYALGYTYNLSKRTNFFAAYSHIKNSKGSANGAYAGMYNRWANVGDTYNDGGAYRTGYQFGLRHNF